MNCGALRRIVRTASRPSSPPASASAGSCRYSRGSSSIAIAVTYGGLLMMRSYDLPGRLSNRSERIRLMRPARP